MPDTFYGQTETETRLQSDTADNIAWVKYSQEYFRRIGNDANDASSSKTSSAASIHSRVEFREVATPTLLHAAISEARASHDNERAEVVDEKGVGEDIKDVKTPESEFDENAPRKSTEGGILERAKHALKKKTHASHASQQPTMHHLPRKHRYVNEGRLIIVTGRSRRLAVEDHRQELRQVMEEYGEDVGPEVRKTIGNVATAFWAARVGSGIVVVQAARAGSA